MAKTRHQTLYRFWDTSSFLLCPTPTAYLIRQSEQHAEEASQVALPGRQFASARVVCSVQSGGAVHDQQSVPDTQEGQSVCQQQKDTEQWFLGTRHTF